jgi:formylglycine-generating enzyme required for sulfatase activity
VTVAAYEHAMGPAPREASWPGGTPAAFAAQSEHCRAARSDARHASLNCVDWDQASAYCARSGARLPTRAEWTTAMQSPGVHVADAFEWTAEARDGSEDHYTCRAVVSSCAQANPRSARNDTLVFRCVSDPR